MAAEKRREGTDPDAGRGLLQAALDQLIEVLWASLRCSRASVMLADGEGEKASLGVAAWRGDLADEAVEARVGSGTSISGSVFASARAQRVDDTDRVDADPRAGASSACRCRSMDACWASSM
jgi:L-methionine (R)-S-oxide reductase